MAAPTVCIRCNGTTFEMARMDPKNSKFAYNAIRCTSCKGAIGVVDWVNNAHELDALRKEVATLTKLVQAIVVALRR